ncbi:hypothetical protein G7Y89_g9390 [Cudoniella acicularis]|uniref:Uncharacterized protein n=1 Tax=Cudoniella acicularis TaxID=354080 RepID=A0A8H4RFP9_9HELO|nr:hypothetical protein G7Y89_g9390 [Cudoniella acicularis]
MDRPALKSFLQDQVVSASSMLRYAKSLDDKVIQELFNNHMKALRDEVIKMRPAALIGLEVILPIASATRPTMDSPLKSVLLQSVESAQPASAPTPPKYQRRAAPPSLSQSISMSGNQSPAVNPNTTLTTPATPSRTSRYNIFYTGSPRGTPRPSTPIPMMSNAPRNTNPRPSTPRRVVPVISTTATPKPSILASADTKKRASLSQSLDSEDSDSYEPPQKRRSLSRPPPEDRKVRRDFEEPSDDSLFVEARPQLEFEESLIFSSI